METVNRYLFGALEQHANLPMQVHGERTWTFAEAARAMHGVALDLRERGIVSGDRVALIAENEPAWMHAYGGILAAGAVVVPRGEDIGDDELFYILEHSGCRFAFAGSQRTADRIADRIPTVILNSESFPRPADLAGDTLSGYATARRPDDLAVILYTSGTTGRPKGVMLEHGNIAHNIRVVPPLVAMQPGDLWLSVLPSWHTFEQTVELCAFAIGCTTAYSDKRRLREDLKRLRPQFFVSVPRVWEAVHDGALAAIERRGRLVKALFRAAHAGTRLWRRRRNPLGLPLHVLGKRLFYGRIIAATGGRLKYAVSGGGALPPHIDAFFQDIDVPLLVGYGLTETAPVVALRDPGENVLGTIGRAVPETELRIGPAGTIQVRGPQVMRGYYRQESLTRAVIDEQGWFDTGDLGRLTEKGDLVFVGRQKETIVLSGGENVEPEPIENAILRSPLVQQVMLVGQDRKALAALVVPESGTTEESLREELHARTGPAAGFRRIEAVNRLLVLDEAFSPENGLMTATLKLRRNVIVERYAERIDSMYA